MGGDLITFAAMGLQFAMLLAVAVGLSVVIPTSGGGSHSAVASLRIFSGASLRILPT